MVLTKRSLFDSATAYAQGGIAAALGAGDSPELHRKDTLAAGAALCDAAAVEVLVEEGPARVRELQTAGAKFDLGADGKLKDTKAVHPESTFSRIYQEVINFCKTNGQFDPTTMGTVPNVGPDGAAGGRVRLARQDLRDSRGRRRQHRGPRHR